MHRSGSGLLRATIDWSHDLLDDREQRLFHHLAVFVGGCALEAAEEIAGANLDTLQSLVEKSLLRNTDGRFWMLETIREYAAERLRERADSETLDELHAGHYLSLAERFEANESLELRPLGFRQLESEHDNMRAARSWFHEHRQSDAELRLLCALDDFWNVRGHLREALGYLDAALKDDEGQSPVLRARALATASDFARYLGAMGQARRFSEESLALFRQLGDNAGVARALHELGETALGEEDYDRANELFEQAIVVGRAAGIDAAASVGNLGWTAYLQGNYERAVVLAEEAIALVRHRGYVSHLLVGLENLAEAELALDRREAARLHLIECLELARTSQHVEATAMCLEMTAALVSRGQRHRGGCAPRRRSRRSPRADRPHAPPRNTATASGTPRRSPGTRARFG